MHTVFALLCFVVVIHWLIFPYPSGLLHWHCGNLTIAPVPAKQPWWIWINTSCEFIMNDCITTTKQSTTKPCAYFLGYTVSHQNVCALIAASGFNTWRFYYHKMRRKGEAGIPYKGQFNLTSQWCNERDGVSNHRRLDCLPSRLFMRRSKKISKLRVSGLCDGNHRWPMDSPHKGPVKRKMFPFDDVIMNF